MTDPRAELLRSYSAKRDFEKTQEPVGQGRPDVKGPIFVVQRHEARRLHYDVRLETDGVLKSWAVPKGPSYDPGEKRLAVMTEDHPLDYADYEGVIPKGEYGGGTVIVWDRGSYVPLTKDHEDATDEVEDLDAFMRKSIERGRVRFRLHGSKLQGAWTLVRMEGRQERGKEAPWLLIKAKDEAADPDHDPTADRTSVLTGRTTEDVVAQEGTPAEVARRLRRAGRGPHPYDVPRQGAEES